MRTLLGCWSRPCEGEHIVCFIPDQDKLLVHTMHRDSLDRPRDNVLIPLVPDGTTTHGELNITTRVEGNAMGVTIEHQGTVVLQQVYTVDGDSLTLEERSYDRTEVHTLHRERVKQVLVYRRDLQMRKGKIAAQCAHASLKVVLDLNTAPGPRIQAALPGPIAHWIRTGTAKIVLSVEDEDALNRVAEAASARGIPVARITDAGKTEFKGVPTRTTVAVGPWIGSAIDTVTGPDGLVPTKLA